MDLVRCSDTLKKEDIIRTIVKLGYDTLLVTMDHYIY